MRVEVAANGPLIHVWLLVVDFDLSLRYDTKVVSRPTYRPEEVWAVLVDSDGSTISEDHAR
jgi:hypothetical protein